jgi:hypothetical protein
MGTSMGWGIVVLDHDQNLSGNQKKMANNGLLSGKCIFVQQNVEANLLNNEMYTLSAH